MEGVKQTQSLVLFKLNLIEKEEIYNIEHLLSPQNDFFLIIKWDSLFLQEVQVVPQHQAHPWVLSFLLLLVGQEVPEDQQVPGEHIRNRLLLPTGQETL